jgi:hypothetical chaperone protein
MRSALHDISIGIDFGTTNTMVAFAGAPGEAEALQFTQNGIVHRIYHSALCFREEQQGQRAQLRMEGGPWAVAQFLEGTAAHRFIQSFKTFAASSSFVDTRVFAERFGEDKPTTGDQLESIAHGLALIGRANAPEAWAVRN